MRVTAPPSKQVTATLGDLQQKIAAAEEQWLELEILREELAGSLTPVRLRSTQLATKKSTSSLAIRDVPR